MNFLVPQATLEAIVRYLGQRPYAEVANLIVSIGQCQLDPKDIEAGKKELAKKEAALKEKVDAAVGKASKKVTPIKKNVKKAKKPTSNSSKS